MRGALCPLLAAARPLRVAGERRDRLDTEDRDMREGRSMEGDHAAVLARTAKATAVVKCEDARVCRSNIDGCLEHGQQEVEE